MSLLLEYGANVAVKAPGAGLGDVTTLSEATSIGDGETFRTVVEHGASVKSAGPAALHFALQSDCDVCRDLMLQTADRSFLSATMLLTAPPRGDARWVKLLLDYGADPNAADRQGRTILMLAASSDRAPVDVIRALLERGADVKATSANSEHAFDFASQCGKTPVVDLLAKAGPQEDHVLAAPPHAPHAADSVRAAVQRSPPLPADGRDVPTEIGLCLMSSQFTRFDDRCESARQPRAVRRRAGA